MLRLLIAAVLLLLGAPSLAQPINTPANIQQGRFYNLTDVAGTNTITATLPFGMQAWTSGQFVLMTAAGTNTGAATLNVNGIGAVALEKNSAAGPVALAAGDLVAGNSYLLRHDGTQIVVMAPTTVGATSGTVTSVGWTGGIVSIANPTTTPAFTVAGVSGGIPYFSSASTWASTPAALGASQLVIGGGAGAAPTTSANLTFDSGTGALAVNGTGHAFGSTAPGTDSNWWLTGTFTGTTNTQGMRLTPALIIPVGGSGYGLNQNASFTTAASGTHALITGTIFQRPGITNLGAAVTNAATVYILNAPTGGSSNYALWVDAGAVRLDDLTASKPVFTDGSQVLTSSGTVPLDQGGTGANITGVSGGIPYFNSTTTMTSSLLLGATGVVMGGGAGTAPYTNSLLNYASGVLSVGSSAGWGVEIGSASGASTSYVDFRNNSAADYDVRLASTAPTGTDGRGTLTLHAGTVSIPNAGNVQGLSAQFGDETWIASVHSGWTPTSDLTNVSVIGTSTGTTAASGAGGKLPLLLGVQGSDFGAGPLAWALGLLSYQNETTDANTTYAAYAEVWKLAAATANGTAQGIEISVNNLYNGASATDPYTHSPAGLVEGQRIYAQSSLGAATRYAASTGLMIGGESSTATFQTGLIFNQYAATGTNRAISMDAAHTINWYSAAATIAATLGNDSGSIVTSKYKSTVATGTAPFIVASTTRVSNLNVATAGTADTLTTARNIGNVSFNGSANIFPIQMHGQAGTSGSTNTTNVVMTYWDTGGGSNKLQFWVDATCLGQMDVNGAITDC